MGRKSKNKRYRVVMEPDELDKEDVVDDAETFSGADNITAPFVMEESRQMLNEGKRRRKKKTHKKVSEVIETLSPGVTDLYCLLHGPKQMKFLNKRVWHSWLTTDPTWISKQVSNKSNHSIHTNFEIRSEIEALKQQLVQIKCRMRPVASDVVKVAETLSNASEAFEEARRISNPFERLGEGKEGGLNRMFANRSAIKLANINALLGFRLTPTKSQHIEQFKFVDLCGAPGGFSEYLSHRCYREGISSHGWGISLLGANSEGLGCEWKLEHMMTRDGGSSTQYRASEGADGTGDIYVWDNIKYFQQEILNDSSNTSNPTNKVDLVVADGGCDAQRNKGDQEMSMIRLVVCQIAAGLSCLKIGGNFVLKYFGSTHPSTKAAFDFLLRSFEKLTVIKPILSRPASAERYIVCLNFSPIDGLNTDYQVWRDSLLNENNHETIDQSLEYYLSKKDRDILKLNISACWAILSHMERRRDAALLQKEDFLAKQMMMFNVIDINKYRQVWCINKSKVAKSLHIYQK